MGPQSLFFKYISYLAALLLGPSITLPKKMIFLLGILAFLINFVLSFLGVISGDVGWFSWLMTVGCIFDGVGTSLLWMVETRYIHLLCEIYNVHDNRGSVFSIFQLIFTMSQIVGAVTTFVFIGYFSSTVYLIVCMVLCLIALLFFLFFIKTIE